ncbi:hypothetical protein [Clostridium sp. D33t1_170424_F3]|uniref:hypothetical protein n=1 Tax=Clostridium sp. D33t1_170424_F3 TaxID=2787099 RepID=UPI0018AA3C65|nr:hypothetical protein [Clostridium sp. D33t1_170424_F3]
MKQDTLNEMFNQLFDSAMREFTREGEYESLIEKWDQIDRECETMLAEVEQGFVRECFETLAEISCRENQYAYRRGMLDCVSLLKALRVLA